IPRSRQEPEAPLVGEVIPKGVPLGRPAVDAQPRDTPRVRPPGKGRTLRTVLIVLGAVALAVGLGGLGVGFIWYDKATTPERGTPVVALEQYLDAKFTNRDPSRAKLFECGGPRLANIDGLLGELEDRERQFGVAIDVRWSEFVVTVNGNSADVES